MVQKHGFRPFGRRLASLCITVTVSGNFSWLSFWQLKPPSQSAVWYGIYLVDHSIWFQSTEGLFTNSLPVSTRTCRVHFLHKCLNLRVEYPQTRTVEAALYGEGVSVWAFASNPIVCPRAVSVLFQLFQMTVSNKTTYEWYFRTR